MCSRQVPTDGKACSLSDQQSDAEGNELVLRVHTLVLIVVIGVLLLFTHFDFALWIRRNQVVCTKATHEVKEHCEIHSAENSDKACSSHRLVPREGFLHCSESVTAHEAHDMSSEQTPDCSVISILPILQQRKFQDEKADDHPDEGDCHLLVIGRMPMAAQAAAHSHLKQHEVAVRVGTMAAAAFFVSRAGTASAGMTSMTSVTSVTSMSRRGRVDVDLGQIFHKVKDGDGHEDGNRLHHGFPGTFLDERVWEFGQVEQ
mmetsp:Transcript_17221/g.37074  ORF Transcript_17221/g.37074 Transcript_17221/m.37074 type:complete len:259 (+) Transcript_17221:907-1683(+)